jgi:porphyrinogen peroxidase
MLTNMFVGQPEGNYDRLLDISTAVTGSLFFVPSLPLLDDIGAGTVTPVARVASPPATNGAASDGSLNIGSLRGKAQ